MDKIKEAQSLVDRMLDECSCNQVGDDKGALPDVPEDVEDSMDDLEDYIMMDESKEVKVSDVPKDKQDIFKLNRAKAGIKGGELTNAEKSGDRVKSVKESDQVKIAQQLDTLFDNPDRMTKDKKDKETSLNPEPTSESQMVFNLAKVNATKKQIEGTKPGEIPVVQGKRSNSESVRLQINQLASEGWLTDKAQELMKKKQDEYKKGNPKGGPVARRNAMLASLSQ